MVGFGRLRRSGGGSRRYSAGGTTARGYGNAHQRLRKEWAARVAKGGVRCARCGGPIAPWMFWDLGHDDVDRSIYRGPEHRKCNRATAGRHKVQAVRVERGIW